MTQTAYSIDELVEKYIQLRDKKTEIKKRHADELKPVDDLMAQLEGIFLNHLNVHGMDSFSTQFGTPYRSTQVTVSVEDWDKFFPWVMEHGHEGMLHRAANKTAVEAYLQGEGHQLPPGLTMNRMYVCNVRRK